MRYIIDTILVVLIVVLLAAVVWLIVASASVMSPSEHICAPPEPEIKLVYVYMMGVPYLDSDFRGLLHDFSLFEDEM